MNKNKTKTPNAGVVAIAEQSAITKDKSKAEVLDSIEEILKDLSLEKQNEILTELVKNNALRRYSEHVVNKSNMQRADEALNVFVKEHPRAEDYIKRHAEDI